MNKKKTILLISLFLTLPGSTIQASTPSPHTVKSRAAQKRMSKKLFESLSPLNRLAVLIPYRSQCDQIALTRLRKEGSSKNVILGEREAALEKNKLQVLSALAQMREGKKNFDEQEV